MECTTVKTSLHAFKRMVQRSISPADIRAVLDSGEIIKHYYDDKPHPSVLILLSIKDRPIHVVVGKNETNDAP